MSAIPARARTGSRPSTSSTGTRSPGAGSFAVIDPGYPDGLKVDAAGLVHSAGPAGVQVFDPDGHSVGAIAVPGAVNFAFAGAGRIFITADTAVWAATTPDPPKEA